MICTNDLYERDLFIIKKYNTNSAKITYLAASRKKGYESNNKFSKKCSINDNKLENNLSRAKTKVKEYALCNSWDYWCTFTISPKKYDRYNLKKYQKDFSEFIHSLNRRRKIKIQYLFIPEMHKDGAWHIHGFLYGLKKDDLERNRNNYLTWPLYNENFGFMSMSKIRDIEKTANYALKYMTKDRSKNVSELNAHLYYCSKGLNTAEEIYCGNGIFHGEWSWEHPEGFCKVKNLDLRTETIEELFEVT